MAKENEIQEPKAASAAELRDRHNAALDSLVAAKKASTRRHAQFLVNAGALKL